MPICTRAGLDKKAEPVNSFKETEKVFFCELTKEIFRDYEEYFQRVMLLNSTIWSCSETSKQNLTYAEALKSEKRARKAGERLSEWIKGPTLLLVNTQQQTSYRTLLSKISVFIKDRFFNGEELASTKSKHHYVPVKILEIIAPKEPPADGVYDPKTLKYKVQKLKGTDTWIAPISNIRRRRTVMSLEMMKVFLKDHTICDENGIHVKPESYEKYVTSKNLTFSSVFIGDMPKWEPGKKMNKGLVQASMGNYVTNDPANSQRELVSLKETMERMRREKEEKQAEQERKRQELMAIVEEEVSTIMRKCDDLERIDQRVMPLFKPVKTLVASKYFSEFLMIQEFLHSFSPVLAASDVFRTNITFQQMCRAFLAREVAGPLSDILQVLLSTIFTLQTEENNDCRVKYVKNNTDGLLWKTANSAVEVHLHVNKYYSAEMFELPIDAQTLSEVLRLHLLSAGATSDERSQSYRYQYRNGYSVTEDPGLLLRIQYPHILRSLKMYTIYQLPFKDILKVVNCLIEQILTYNATITCLEERQENQIKVRNNLRSLVTIENKRIQTLQNTKKTMSIELQTEIAECKGDADKVTELQRVFNKKIKELDEQDVRLKGNFQYHLDKMNVELFDYLTLLGSDRAYRNYYVLESLPGLFIEHPDLEEAVPCLENPPRNDEALAIFPKDRHRLKTFLCNRHRQGDKENVNKPAEPSEANVAPVNGEVVKVNGTSNGVSTTEKEVKTPPTPTDLYMCSGESKTCIVHNSRHTSRIHWSFINTVEEFDALLESLNSGGIREGVLKEILVKARKQIVSHIAKCPAPILSVDPEDREKSMQQMLTETQKKYANSNFGHAENADINDVMKTTLTNQILEFEQDITVGNLGKMKISDLGKWRQNIADSTYESQCKKLKYGPESVNDGENDFVWVDVSRDLGDTLDIESEDSADDEVCVLDSPTMRQSVLDLASALLQIEQCIEQKYLKEPFGIKNQTKNRVEDDTKMAAGKVKLQEWEVSLMNSTNYSQVFLHLNILSDAVKWNKSSLKSSCLVCKRKGDAEKLLLCDECNAGTHMFCMKPPMKTVPEGNWYCFRCELKLGLNNAGKPKKKAKKIFSMEEEEKDEVDLSESKSTGRNKKSKKGKKKAKFESLYCESDEAGSASSENELDDKSWTVADHSKKIEKKKSKKNGRPEDYDTEDDKPLKTNGWTKKNGKSTPKNATPVESGTDEDDAEETLNEEDVDETLNDDDDTDDDKCKTCNTDGTDLSCNSCKDCYHLECTGLRRMPRGNWVCLECKAQEKEKKRKATDIGSESEDDAYEENESFRATKRQRRSHTKDISLSSEDVSKNNNNSRRSRRTEEFLKLDTISLYDLLEQIMKHKSAWPFLRPVSANEVPDYHTIIKSPMDFARIKSNLNMCRYSTNEDVIKDIELVFSNCDTYNTQGNEIYSAGASLERFVVEKCKEFNLKFTPSDMIADEA